MFNNIGSKIKSYAKVIFWIGAVISIIAGIAVIVVAFLASSSVYEPFAFGKFFTGFILGIITAIIGIILSWIGVLVLYGFGVLVENSDTLKQLQQSKTMNESNDSTIE